MRRLPLTSAAFVREEKKTQRLSEVGHDCHMFTDCRCNARRCAGRVLKTPPCDILSWLIVPGSRHATGRQDQLLFQMAITERVGRGSIEGRGS